MKKYKISVLITFVALLYVLIQAQTSAAYQVAWTSIRHEVYETGGDKNRLAFEITDDSGNYVSSASVVSGVVLKNPAGSPVNLSTYNGKKDFYPWIINRFKLRLPGKKFFFFGGALPINRGANAFYNIGGIAAKS